MDDPWGSPWATNDSISIPEPPPRASTTLELPGRILARDRSSSSLSPWAVEENGGFNDWAAAEPGLSLPPTVATPGSTWSGWGGDNGLNSSQTQLSARPRGESSPAWPPSPSPGLFPAKTVSRRSSSRSLSKQPPTPDPWATEASRSRLSLPAAVHIAAEQAAFATMDSHDELEEQKVGTAREEDAHAESGLGITATFENGPEQRPNNGPEVKLDGDIFQGARSPVNTEPKHGDEEGRPGSPSASRHSSTSNESHREDRPDSPITSMDEDAKDRPPAVRRTSTRVQDMVELFDGLNKRKDSSTLLVPDPGGRRQSASRSGSIRSIKTDGASDFGDFEDGGGFDDSTAPSRKSSVSGSRSNSRAGRLRSASKTSLRQTSTVLSSTPIPEEPSKFEAIRAQFGPVQFGADKDLVDKLFNVAKLDAEQPPSKDYSLDTVEGIITDSFTTISERKTWYRISRHGTMRRHDLGDDDNYRRVTWADSKVKDEATKIVRRWMQEDAYYAGRPKAGGGPMVRGGGFDWDSNKSKAETLSFDEIFGKRKSVQTPKLSPALSLQAPGHSRTSSDGVQSLPAPSSMSIPAPPASNGFGWSTGDSGASTPPFVRPPSLVRQSIEASPMRSGSSRPPSLREADAQPSQLPAPKPALESSESMQRDDDDEWGEMVASPTIDTNPTSGSFGFGLEDSMASFPATSVALPAATPDTPTSLNSVSSALKGTANATDIVSQNSSTVAPVDVWDFSVFDSTSAAPAIPLTATSKPEIDFDTPLPSPTSSIAHTASPASIHSSKAATPTITSRSGSPVADLARAPTPPIAFRPQHTSKSSLGLVRPSPLHHVVTPEPATPAVLPVVPVIPPSDPVMPVRPTAPKTVSFAEDEVPVDDTAVRRVVEGLPDLSYMFR